MKISHYFPSYFNVKTKSMFILWFANSLLRDNDTRTLNEIKKKNLLLSFDK